MPIYIGIAPDEEPLKNRFPSFANLVSVYSVIAAIVYGWTVVVFFWKFPSWLLVLTVGEILSAFSYVMVAAMAESMLVLGVITVLCLLPAVWTTRENFIVRGSWLAMGGYGSLMLLLKLNQLFPGEFLRYWWGASLAGILLTALLAVFSPRIRPLRTFVLWISDRLQVFLFILIPVFFISLLNVVLRNLN